MEYSVQWYIKGRIVYMRFPAVVTYELINEAVTELTHYLEHGKVHVVSDVTRVIRTPMNVLKLKEISSVISPDSIGWGITVTNNSALKFLAMLIPQLLGEKQFRTFSSVDEAIAFLYKHEPDLAELPIEFVEPHEAKD